MVVENFLNFKVFLQRLIYGGSVLLESFSIYSKEIFFINNFIANPLLEPSHASIQKINLYLTRCFVFRMTEVSDNQIKCNINIW